MNPSKFYPYEAKNLLTKTGADVIKSIGNETVREAVLAVLEGENLRNSTEFITRRRLAISNGAMLMMFLDACAQLSDPKKELMDSSVKALQEGRLPKRDKWILEWILGLNDKAVQNILRDDPKQLNEYQQKLEKVLLDADDHIENTYGKMAAEFTRSDGTKTTFDWDLLIKLLLSIGAQTLTIRGSEKSTYGKLFEKLILGTLLEVLGFKQVDKNNMPEKPSGVFWLSQTEKRESDATLIFEPGKGIRFDIGFIGRGNSEISLDKVTRFEREITIGRTKHYMGTYIIIDRIGGKSKIVDLAKLVGGDIIQMSLSFWIRDIALLLERDLGFKHPIAKMNDKELGSYLHNRISQIEVTKFI